MKNKNVEKQRETKQNQMWIFLKEVWNIGIPFNYENFQIKKL